MKTTQMKPCARCVFFGFVIIVILAGSQVTTQKTIYAEEGKHAKISCEFYSSNMSEVEYQEWSSAGSADKIAKCVPDKTCSNFGSAFTANLAGTVSSLSIPSVSRVTPFNMSTSWTCRWVLYTEKKERKEDIRLVVYARPRNVSCDFQLDNVASPRAVCLAEGVYPMTKGYAGSAVVSHSKTKEFKHDNVTGLAVRMNVTGEYYAIKFNATWDRFYLGTNYLKFRLSFKDVVGNIIYNKDSDALIYRTGLIDPLTNSTIDPELDSGVPSSEERGILLITFGALAGIFVIATVVLSLCLSHSRKTREFQPAAEEVPTSTKDSTKKCYNNILPDECDQHDYEPVAAPELQEVTLGDRRSPVKVMLSLESGHPGGRKQSKGEEDHYANFTAISV